MLANASLLTCSTKFTIQSKHKVVQLKQEVITMKNYRIELLITKNRARLERMIKEDYSRNKILRQSQKLDKYINIIMRELVK